MQPWENYIPFHNITELQSLLSRFISNSKNEHDDQSENEQSQMLEKIAGNAYQLMTSKSNVFTFDRMDCYTVNLFHMYSQFMRGFKSISISISMNEENNAKNDNNHIEWAIYGRKWYQTDQIAYFVYKCISIIFVDYQLHVLVTRYGENLLYAFLLMMLCVLISLCCCCCIIVRKRRTTSRRTIRRKGNKIYRPV